MRIIIQKKALNILFHLNLELVMFRGQSESINSKGLELLVRDLEKRSFVCLPNWQAFTRKRESRDERSQSLIICVSKAFMP